MPTLLNDCRISEANKKQPGATIGFGGAHAAVLPAETSKASLALDWVGRKEFDFTCEEVAEGRSLESIAGLSSRNRDGRIRHKPESETINGMDALPWVANVYRRPHLRPKPILRILKTMLADKVVCVRRLLDAYEFIRRVAQGRKIISTLRKGLRMPQLQHGRKKCGF